MPTATHDAHMGTLVGDTGGADAMAKFTVIEGGDSANSANFHDGLARRALRRFIVEILRALARGHDVSGRSARELAKLVEHLSSADTSLNSIVDDVVAELHAAEYEDLARKWRELAAKVESLDRSTRIAESELRDSDTTP
jgi:hypothetical protein